jgi:hypothetical protein
MAFRIGDQSPVYFDSDGVTPCASGTLTTFINSTTTPVATYSDIGLSVSNGTSITLNSVGRSPVEIWSGATIRVVLKNVNGTTIWTRDNVQSGSGLPSLVTNGYLYSPDGSTLACATIRQVPDPTGNSGKYLTNDGSSASWAPLAARPNLQITSQTITAAATTNIDFSLGGDVLLNQATAITSLTFTNLAASGTAMFITIQRVKDATGTSRAITWPASIKWPGGVPPTLTQTTGAVDIFGLRGRDGGTTWYGTYNCGLA